MMTEERTPRTDAIALRLVGKSGLFCDPESLEQYNDLVVVARQLERELAEALEERDAAFAMSRCECGTDEACANLARLHAELAEARKALANACDNTRDFPANTCPASRHVQQMAEGLLSGGYPMLSEEPAHCAESMLATVKALWEARREVHVLSVKLANANRKSAGLIGGGYENGYRDALNDAIRNGQQWAEDWFNESTSSPPAQG